MRIIFFIIFAFTLNLFYSCRQNKTEEVENALTEGQGEIVIEGKMEDGPGTELILEEMAAREFIPLDTVLCDKDSSFRFTFSSNHEAFYALRSENGVYNTLLISPGEHLVYRGSTDRTRHYDVTGSKGSELLQKLSEEHKRILNELSGIARIKRETYYDPGYVSLSMELDRKFDSIADAFQDYSEDFIMENRNSLAILIALYNLYGQGLPVFDPYEDLEIYVFVDSVLNQSHPESEFVRELHVHVNDALAGQQNLTHSPGLERGEIAPDFVSSRPDGKQVALSEFRGSYVLVCFWASWSEGSREEHPYLRKAWERYGEKGLKIVQAGFETERTSWVEAIGEDQLGWIQVSDLKGWKSPVADLYQVERIPSNYLVGPGGKVLEKDLLGDDLLSQLDQIFN